MKRAVSIIVALSLVMSIGMGSFAAVKSVKAAKKVPTKNTKQSKKKVKVEKVPTDPVEAAIYFMEKSRTSLKAQEKAALKAEKDIAKSERSLLEALKSEITSLEMCSDFEDQLDQFDSLYESVLELNASVDVSFDKAKTFVTYQPDKNMTTALADAGKTAYVDATAMEIKLYQDIAKLQKKKVAAEKKLKKMIGKDDLDAIEAQFSLIVEQKEDIVDALQDIMDIAELKIEALDVMSKRPEATTAPTENTQAPAQPQTGTTK